MNPPQEKSDTENVLSKEFYETIFMQAGDGIFLIDERGIMLEMNPRGCEILGYTRDELRGQPVMKFHPADEIDHIQKELGRLATEKLITIESAYIRKDGSRVPVEITGKLLSNNQIIGLLRDISERKKAERVTQELLSTDSLTGLYNRRYFFGIVNSILAESVRYGHPAAILLLDLDHFKQINDAYGHMKGDQALRHLANGIRSLTRAADVIARFGGDEFVILLPQTDEAQAVHMAERLHRYLSENPVRNTDVTFFITLSIGVSSIPAQHKAVSIETLLEQADRALYQAKQQGRNQTCKFGK
jgi:diguanylate cyclase (GGDEF)-like protein/PAS domain S-box-containing protein